MEWWIYRRRGERLRCFDRSVAAGVFVGAWLFLSAAYAFYLSPVVPFPTFSAFILTGVALLAGIAIPAMVLRLFPRIPALTLASLFVVWIFLFPVDFPRIGWTLILVGVVFGAITAIAVLSRRRALRVIAFSVDAILFAAGIALCVRDTDKSPDHVNGGEVVRIEYGAGADECLVDGSAYFRKVSRIDSMVRRNILGFGSEALPLRGVVYLPRDGQESPLLVMLHGSHYMLEESHPGYEYLALELAARGYAVALIDENFINKSFSGSYGSHDYKGRGWLLLKNLEYLRTLVSDDSSPFHGKIDFDNMAFAGHSRGGDGVASAMWLNGLDRSPVDPSESFDFNFGIKGVIEIAPTAMLTMPDEMPYKYNNVDYLLLHGDKDADVSFLYGLRRYNLACFTDSAYHFKAAVLIDGANHGQFNTVWGADDRQPPASWLLDRSNAIDGELQRRLAVDYIAAFLDVSLRNAGEIPEILRKGAQPGDMVRWDDTQCRYAARFDDCPGREGVTELLLRDNSRMTQYNHGMCLDKEGRCHVGFDTAMVVTPGQQLLFSAFSGGQIGLAVSLFSGNDIVAADTVTVTAPPVKRLSLMPLLFPVQGDGEREQFLSTFCIPLPLADSVTVTAVRFSRVGGCDVPVIVDDIGFRRHFER